MEVNGYLEVNGVITKITSVDALKILDICVVTFSYS